jgi:hypothetical protein
MQNEIFVRQNISLKSTQSFFQEGHSDKQFLSMEKIQKETLLDALPPVE